MPNITFKAFLANIILKNCVTDATLGESSLGQEPGQELMAGPLEMKLFSPQSMAPWATVVIQIVSRDVSRCCVFKSLKVESKMLLEIMIYF